MNPPRTNRLAAFKNKFERRLHSVVNFLRISKTARRVWRDNLTYLSPTKLKQLEQEARRIHADGIPGDFAEFGVALGGCAILLASHAVLASHAEPTRAFHGFDVFGMIPQPTSAKDGAKSAERYDNIASGNSVGLGGTQYYGYRRDLYHEVTESFRRYQVPMDGVRVHLHKGLFEETWPDAQRQIQAVALVHIDCDWYEPVKFCLEHSDPKLAVGGVIVVDDYFAYPGAREATDEFLAQHANYFVTCGNLHLIMRKTA